MTSEQLTRGAIFNQKRTHRFRLWRVLRLRPDLPRMVACLLNPSDASETTEDPTLVRLMGYANAWGFGRLDVVNLFSIVATDPRGLYAREATCWGSLLRSDATVDDTDRHITEAVINSDLVLCGWGSHPLATARAREIWPTLALGRGERVALRVNKDGSPVHCLYQPASLKPSPYALPEAA